MWGKTLSKILPLPFWFSLGTALVFLLVILAAFAYARQFDQPINLIKRLLISPETSFPKYEIIGFLPSWNAAKQVRIDTSNLTQIIYFGFSVNAKGEIIQFDTEGNETLEWVYFKSPYFKKVRDAAGKTNTKVLVAIKSSDNGPTSSNENIDGLISNPVATEKFIKQLAKIIKEHKLDGVNIDFEYFTDSDFPTSKHLNTFFTKLSEKLKAENPEFIISADFNAGGVVIDPAYDMVKLGQVLDQVILMGYDYSTPVSTQAGPVAPLYSGAQEASIDNSISSMKGRVPFEKLILAIPFYGYEWQTISNNFQSKTIPGSGALATYDRITQLINSRNDIEINWDNKSLTPWLTYSQSGAFKQIYFENEQSIAKKLDYIKDKKLAGAGIWAIGYEGENETFWNLIRKFKAE